MIIFLFVISLIEFSSQVPFSTHLVMLGLKRRWHRVLYLLERIPVVFLFRFLFLKHQPFRFQMLSDEGMGERREDGCLIILTQISHEGEAMLLALNLPSAWLAMEHDEFRFGWTLGRCIPRKFSERFFWGYATLVTIGKLLIAIGREHWWSFGRNST